MFQTHKRHLLGRHHLWEKISTGRCRMAHCGELIRAPRSHVSAPGSRLCAPRGAGAVASLGPAPPFLHAPLSSLSSRKAARGLWEELPSPIPGRPGLRLGSPHPRCLSLLPGRGGRGVGGGGRNQQAEQPAPRGQLLQAQGLPGSWVGSLPPCAPAVPAPARLGGSPPGPRPSGIPGALVGAAWSRCLDGPPLVHTGRCPECRSPRARAEQGTAEEGAGPAAGWAPGPQGCRPFPRSLLASADGPAEPGAPPVLTLPWFCTEEEQQAEEGSQRGGGGRGPGLPRQPEPRVSALPPRRALEEAPRQEGLRPLSRRQQASDAQAQGPHGGEGQWGPRAGTPGCRARLASAGPCARFCSTCRGRPPAPSPSVTSQHVHRMSRRLEHRGIVDA